MNIVLIYSIVNPVKNSSNRQRKINRNNMHSLVVTVFIYVNASQHSEYDLQSYC